MHSSLYLFCLGLIVSLLSQSAVAILTTRETPSRVIPQAPQSKFQEATVTVPDTITEDVRRCLYGNHREYRAAEANYFKSIKALKDKTKSRDTKGLDIVVGDMESSREKLRLEEKNMFLGVSVEADLPDEPEIPTGIIRGEFIHPDTQKVYQVDFKKNDLLPATRQRNNRRPRTAFEAKEDLCVVTQVAGKIVYFSAYHSALSNDNRRVGLGNPTECIPDAEKRVETKAANVTVLEIPLSTMQQRVASRIKFHGDHVLIWTETFKHIKPANARNAEALQLDTENKHVLNTFAQYLAYCGQFIDQPARTKINSYLRERKANPCAEQDIGAKGVCVPPSTQKDNVDKTDGSN